MKDLPEAGDQPRHVVAICGGAVAGSEAAALFAEQGALAIVVEQNALPYGKIDDGLPRWHSALQAKERARIDANLDRDGVIYVPGTRLGRDLSFDGFSRGLGFTMSILANGAWRDRPLPVPGVEAFVDRGLVYQNAFVYWFNHHEEEGYGGPQFDPPEGAIVIGGGLASIDCAKIINLLLYRRALTERGTEIGLEELEARGIDAVLAAHGIDRDELGVQGATLYYRRAKEDMPIAGVSDPTPGQMDKIRAARVRIMERVERKFLVRFVGQSLPVAPIVEGDALAGLVFRKTATVDGRMREVEDSDFRVRSPMVVCSIGSIPAPMPGLPMIGELYHFADHQTGQLAGFDTVFALGNALTGKGNIKLSRDSARQVAEQVAASYLGIDEGERRPEVTTAVLQGEVMDVIRAVVARGVAREPLPAAKVGAILEWVAERWRAVGYDGDYRGWVERHHPRHRVGSVSTGPTGRRSPGPARP